MAILKHTNIHLKCDDCGLNSPVGLMVITRVDGKRVDTCLECVQRSRRNRQTEVYRNGASHKDAKIPFRGVDFHRNRFRARVTLNGTRRQLGRFNTAVEASLAVEAFLKESRGRDYVAPDYPHLRTDDRFALYIRR
jgi:hypothetical protein